MPLALEALDHTVQRLEQGEIGALEAIDALLGGNRRIAVALSTARLMPVKTFESFDFTFQPSLDSERVFALGQPGTRKSHLATALDVAAVQAGRSVYRWTLPETSL